MKNLASVLGHIGFFRHAGYSDQEIARQLNRVDAQTPNRESYWTVEMVQRIARLLTK